MAANHARRCQALGALVRSLQAHEPQRGLTFEQRSSLYDRPSQVVYIDAIDAYILHAQGAFTGLPWLKAVPRDDAATAAKFLAEDVFLEFAGFPTVLRSDQGSIYVNEVVAELNARFGVEQAFGSSYREPSQGYIEGSHQRNNNLIRADARRGEWSRWVWAMRHAMLAAAGPRRYQPL